MSFDLEKVRANVREAETADLLDRATVWREGIVPEVLDVIEAELCRRGVRAKELEEHARRRAGNMILRRDGLPAVCYYCSKPAVMRRWVWGRMWRIGPPFPRRACVCEEHAPKAEVVT
jgi:hypothetical protein